MLDPIAPVCVWLKRDLRVTDHPALAEAAARARGGAVFGLFLFEPEVLAQPEWDSSHTEFQRECLVELEAALGRLGIRARHPPGWGGGPARRASSFSNCRRPASSAGSRRETAGTGSGKSGWRRAQAPLPRSTGHGGRESIARLATSGILGCRDLGIPTDTKDRQRGGERAAESVLDDFLDHRGRPTDSARMNSHQTGSPPGRQATRAIRSSMPACGAWSPQAGSRFACGRSLCRSRVIHSGSTGVRRASIWPGTSSTSTQASTGRSCRCRAVRRASTRCGSTTRRSRRSNRIRMGSSSAADRGPRPRRARHG